MANVSHAIGTMYVPKDFYTKHKNVFDNDLLCMGYGFCWLNEMCSIDSNKDSVALDFEANGKWSFYNTIQQDWCWNQKNDPAVKKIWELEKPNIKLVFKDYDPGTMFFDEEEVVLSPCVKIHSYQAEQLDCCDSCLIDECFEEAGLYCENVSPDNPDVIELYNKYNKDISLQEFTEKLKERIESCEETKGAVSLARLEEWYCDPNYFADFLEDYEYVNS